MKPILPKRNPLKQFTHTLLEDAAKRAAKEVKREFEAVVRNWRDKPEFRIDIASGGEVRVTTDHKVFLYQNFGTRPHVILPRRKKALSWPRASHPVKRVNHPGTRAQRYDLRVAKSASGILLRVLNEALRRV